MTPLAISISCNIILLILCLGLGFSDFKHRRIEHEKLVTYGKLRDGLLNIENSLVFALNILKDLTK